MTAVVYDDRQCVLGEGPLWHPVRKQLYWFDITERKLLTRSADEPSEWLWDEEVSAAGWVGNDTLIVASASALWRFDLNDGSRKQLCPLETNNAVTRSNDGRADPWGGFWIGTMGRKAEPGAGAIYRYYQGQLRRLIPDITISNAICFAPDRSCAYYTDTSTSQIMSVPLDRSGWPAGNAVVHLDLSIDGLNPDGAVTDADGTLWVAQWGASRVAAYKDGTFQRAIDLPAAHVTCPAFGGEDYSTLFVATAQQGLSSDDLAANDAHGQTFAVSDVAIGRAEPEVLL